MGSHGVPYCTAWRRKGKENAIRRVLMDAARALALDVSRGYNRFLQLQVTPRSSEAACANPGTFFSTRGDEGCKGPSLEEDADGPRPLTTPVALRTHATHPGIREPASRRLCRRPDSRFCPPVRRGR